MFMDSDDVMFGYGRKVTLEQKQGVLFFVVVVFFQSCSLAEITEHTLDNPLSAV